MSLDVSLVAVRRTAVFDRNITHNLAEMAAAAGIYEAIWRPEEIGVRTAEQLLPLLNEGLAKLKADPAKFKVLEPENKWGSYGGLVRFVEAYIEACDQNPDAEIEVYR